MTATTSTHFIRHLLRAGVLIALLLALAALMPAWAATAGKDCAPVGSLPTYHSSDSPTLRAYESAEFEIKKGDASAKVPVTGAYCYQSYSHNAGQDPLSDLEIQSNYRDQLTKLGAQILYTDDRNTDAKLVRGTQETWIKIYSQETEIDVTVVNKRALVQTLTVPSGKDYRLLGHMPGYAPDEPRKRNFDEASFTVTDGDDTKKVKAQGALYELSYSKAGAQTSSDLEIQENYRNALKKLGAQILYADDRNTDARLIDNGQTIWVKIYSQETEIDITVVEEKAFQASIKPAQASELKAALDKDGHVALYINFDFDKATLRPDAKPVIAQVLALLKDNPGLKLSIVGNTDNVGSHDYNVKLSQARAATVVAELVKDGIAAGRLTSSGDGPDKPVADNDSSEGRAKNRRVELVKA